MHYKAIIQVRNAVHVNHGWSTVLDLPLGRYDSEDGEFTVLERVASKDHDVLFTYFMVEMHNPDIKFEQEPNEYMNLYVRPLGLSTKQPEDESPYASIMPNKAFVKEVVDQFRLYFKSRAADDVFVSVADMLERWLEEKEANDTGDGLHIVGASYHVLDNKINGRYKKFVATLVDMTNYSKSPLRDAMVKDLENAIEKDCIDEDALLEMLIAAHFCSNKILRFSKEPV